MLQKQILVRFCVVVVGIVLCCVFLKIIDLVIAPVRMQHQETTNTVKPLLSGLPIKRTLSRVPKLTSYVSLYNEPLFRGHLY